MSRQSLGSNRTTLSALINTARTAMGFQDHTPQGFSEPTRRIAVPAVASGLIQLADYVPAAKAQASTGINYDKPQGRPAGELIRLEAELANKSRVCTAGASLIAVNTAPEGMTGGGDELALYSRPTKFRVIKPAPFGTLADGANVTASTFPVNSAQISIATAPTHAVRFDISRRDQKSLTDDLLTYEILKAIAWGLANEADKVLLAAIQATTPAAFGLGKAAAKSLDFAELAALVGTDGTGAAVSQDGTLRVSGIDAELTSGMTGTIVGAFGKSAVAIHDELHILLKRTDVEGSLEVTAFANIMAMIPDAGFFWSV